MGLLDQILGGLAGRGGVGGGLGGPGGMGQGGGVPMGRAPGGRVNTQVLMALLPIVLNLLANRRRGGSMPGMGGGMGGLGGVLGGLGGRGASAGGLGGLAGLLGQLGQHGYGQQAQSWVGTGENEPLPPEALSHVFDQQQLSEIASEAGVSEDEARLGLSELLPEVVDRFTPQGQLLGEDELNNSIDDFVRQLGG
ncbi:YidB family protein [Azohydromonas australica]|uniref:YidB family protein n=1 Tax=Azohydromonas australica TaxID=364039 RepID=UPI0004211F2C|nr:YidB family protein [Azohydromonas australica]